MRATPAKHGRRLSAVRLTPASQEVGLLLAPLSVALFLHWPRPGQVHLPAAAFRLLEQMPPVFLCLQQPLRRSGYAPGCQQLGEEQHMLDDHDLVSRAAAGLMQAGSRRGGAQGS